MVKVHRWGKIRVTQSEREEAETCVIYRDQDGQVWLEMPLGETVTCYQKRWSTRRLILPASAIVMEMCLFCEENGLWRQWSARRVKYGRDDGTRTTGTSFFKLKSPRGLEVKLNTFDPTSYIRVGVTLELSVLIQVATCYMSATFSTNCEPGTQEAAGTHR